MAALAIIRHAIFGTVLLCSIAVLALSAWWASVTSLDDGIIFSFNTLAIANGVLTLIIIIPVLVVGHIRRGAVITMLGVEVAWVAFLAIMWLAEGGITANGELPFLECRFSIGDLGNDPNDPGFDLVLNNTIGICQAWPAITALTFVIWASLTGWLITLLTFGFRGNHWKTDVTDPQVSQIKNTSNVNHGNMTQQAAPPEKPGPAYSYPPSQQQTPLPQLLLQQPQLSPQAEHNPYGGSSIHYQQQA